MSAVERTADTAPGYVHLEKVVRTAQGITLGETVLKWYEVAPKDAPVPLVARVLARRSLRDACRSGALDPTGELGFVILHRCGEGFYFLLVCTWRNENELWESIWAKAGDHQPLFEPWPRTGTHAPTFCVWELAAVCHERLAWGAYLRSTRDAEARRTYVASTYEGAA